MQGGVLSWHGSCKLWRRMRTTTIRPGLGFDRAQTEVCATGAGVESSHLRGAGKIGGMARENLLSLFEEFDRYGSDVACVQRRDYRREAWTYSKLAAMAVGCAL